MPAGSWTLVEELFIREAAEFVEELRKVHHADRLGDFAQRWISDPRPFAREALFEYLSRPLNCYRHEALVKRLFKLAHKAGDDELLGAFLVAFDRLIRRKRVVRHLRKYETFSSQLAADAAQRAWLAEGYRLTSSWSGGGSFTLYLTKPVEVIVVPSNTRMPRPAKYESKKAVTLSDAMRQRFEKKFRLYSMPTRHYLRRRAWRYFRLLGKTDPQRYLRAAVRFLARYTDEDTDSDIHLLDNWGLVHALFRHSPAVRCPARGWEFAPGKTIADLAPAPRYEAAWREHPEQLFELLLKAAGRTVRQWAIVLLRTLHEAWLAAQAVPTLLRLADHVDAGIAELGFDLLGKASDLESVPVQEWLKRLQGNDFAKLQRFSALLVRRLDPARVATVDALRLASHQSKPVAELGFSILQRRSFASADVGSLLPLVQAECHAVRPALTLWLKQTLESFGPIQASWLLEFLDSRHVDVRSLGWEWLAASPLRDEPAVWHKLIESPYDDIRGPLIEALKTRTKGADPDAVRLLWASVLLNVARGGRYKAGVVAQVVDRLAAHPAEVDTLVPLLAVAVRSLRGPEFRTGLAGLVRLAETKPALVPAIRERFPELTL